MPPSTGPTTSGLCPRRTGRLESFLYGYLFTADTAYIYGTDWRGRERVTSKWWLIGYDSGTEELTALYDTTESSLDGSYWYQLPGADPTRPTTLCAQHTLILPFSVAAGTVTNVMLPSEAMLSTSPAVQTNSLHVVASQPIAIYARPATSCG